jgi:hypothetical protein
MRIDFAVSNRIPMDENEFPISLKDLKNQDMCILTLELENCTNQTLNTWVVYRDGKKTAKVSFISDAFYLSYCLKKYGTIVAIARLNLVIRVVFPFFFQGYFLTRWI